MKRIRRVKLAALAITAGLMMSGSLPAAEPAAKADPAAPQKGAETTAKQAGATTAAPRFSILDTNCVIDNKSGLMWARNASLTGTNQLSWTDAIAFCKNLDYGGHKDWRLPQIREFWDLMDTKYPRLVIPNTAGTDQMKDNDPFRNVQSIAGGLRYYWATTTTTGKPAGPWLITMFNGDVAQGQGCETNIGWVWPVRSGK